MLAPHNGLLTKRKSVINPRLGPVRWRVVCPTSLAKVLLAFLRNAICIFAQAWHHWGFVLSCTEIQNMTHSSPGSTPARPPWALSCPGNWGSSPTTSTSHPLVGPRAQPCGLLGRGGHRCHHSCSLSEEGSSRHRPRGLEGWGGRKAALTPGGHGAGNEDLGRKDHYCLDFTVRGT